MINYVKYFVISKYFLYLLLALPSIGMISIMEHPMSKETFDQLTHTSGEFSARLLIITLLISPIRVIFKKARFWKWMAKHKRIFGVYAFYYTVIHMVAYFLYRNFDEVISDFSKVTYLAGWLALLILLPLTITSTDWMIRKLGGKRWKNLHRMVYLAAVFTAVHWVLKSNEASAAAVEVVDNATTVTKVTTGEHDHSNRSPVGPVLIHFTPLFLLEMNRFYRYLKVRKKKIDTTLKDLKA